MEAAVLAAWPHVLLSLPVLSRTVSFHMLILASSALDEFGAVSRRLPVWQLYERARSLGLAVQVSAQSWAGLAADQDQRYRIAASADGGI